MTLLWAALFWIGGGILVGAVVPLLFVAVMCAWMEVEIRLRHRRRLAEQIGKSSVS